MANVKVRLKDASGNILHPETEWSVIKNPPAVYDKAYALDKPDHILPDFPYSAWTMPTKVSFGLIQIDESNSDKQFQSFYIVVAKRTSVPPTEEHPVPSFNTRQELYYVDFKNTTPYCEWKRAAIEYSDSTTTYSYGYGDNMYTVYLTPLLKR